MYVQNSLGVINFVRTIVIGLMTVRIDNAVKYECNPLSSAPHITLTALMTVRIGNAAKCKCSRLNSAVHITFKNVKK